VVLQDKPYIEIKMNTTMH